MMAFNRNNSRWFRHIPGPIIALLIAGFTAYWAAQVAITKELGDRPSRQEMKQETDDIRGQIRRELDTIQQQQMKMFEMLRDLHQDMKNRNGRR